MKSVVLFSVAAVFVLLASEPVNATPQIHLALTGSADSMSVSWRTEKQQKDSAVEYGLASSTTTKSVEADDTRTYRAYGFSSGHYHHAEMTGLKSGSKYRYRISTEANGADPSPWMIFTAAQQADTESMRMIFVGDYGLGGAGPPAEEGQCTADAFAAHAADASKPLDMIWVAGDIAYANMHGAKAFEPTWNSCMCLSLKNHR